MSHNAETAPHPGAAPEVEAAAKPLNRAHSSRFDPRGAVDDVWVFVVQPEDGRYRRRVFLSPGPAWLAARRAADRGYSAGVVLCRLQPVSEVPR